MEKKVYSVDGFCSAHEITKAFFYKLQRQGNGPACMKLGRRTLVSVEAADAWRRSMEARQNPVDGHGEA